MASNSFGTLFRITTWGESHGKAVGVVIDGCPAGLPCSVHDIQGEMGRRAPGNSPYTSARKEPDEVEILSGVFEGVTTGTPISLLIKNADASSRHYEPIKELLRPGHANFTYLKKYGVYDYRGGGRASARETACRVAAGAIAKKWLRAYGVEILAYLKAAGQVASEYTVSDIAAARAATIASPIYAADSVACAAMIEEIDRAKQEGDSVGGIVEVVATGVPVGWGDPIYEKLEANIAKAMMSLPASRGVEVGSGFEVAAMRGSTCNDLFARDGEDIITTTNHAGGIQGGISNGMPIVVRVAFKPPSSLAIPQKTLSIDGKETTLELPPGSRHDPCVAIRAVSVVEAMLACVLMDAALMANAHTMLST